MPVIVAVIAAVLATAFVAAIVPAIRAGRLSVAGAISAWLDAVVDRAAGRPPPPGACSSAPDACSTWRRGRDRPPGAGRDDAWGARRGRRSARLRRELERVVARRGQGYSIRDAASPVRIELAGRSYPPAQVTAAIAGRHRHRPLRFERRARRGHGGDRPCPVRRVRRRLDVAWLCPDQGSLVQPGRRGRRTDQLLHPDRIACRGYDHGCTQRSDGDTHARGGDLRPGS